MSDRAPNALQLPAVPRRRTFFALWPAPETAAAIVRATRGAVQMSSGRPMAKHNLHVTLAFLGELDAERFEAARGAAPITVGAFDLRLDRVGHWAQSRVLWLAPNEVPEALRELEARLWAALTARGFEREPREFAPHVTLARRARPIEGELVEPVPWRAEELALVESLPAGRNNVHYEVLARWPI